MASKSLACRICGNQHNPQRFVVREMLFGTKEEFTYFECASCASLQIGDVPADLSKYYPSDYLGAVPGQAGKGNAWTDLARMSLRRQRAHYLLYGKNWLGWFSSKIGKDYFDYEWEWFRKAAVTCNSRILDIGCGPGRLLKSLQNQGFRKLAGIDPFQERTIPGLEIHRCQLNEHAGQYDFIMLHHSLEHMPDPAAALVDVKRLCSPGGKVLVRIPVANCYAWEQYGVDWYQIDAPRHLAIPSTRGMKILAERAGLHLDEVVFDSDELQFCCSEQYKQGIPLKDTRSYHKNHRTDLFTSAQVESFKKRSADLNKIGHGDQACFYLRNEI